MSSESESAKVKAPVSSASSGAKRWAVRIFDFLASLKLAVVSILGLALCLAVATTLESLYDTPTAQFWVYRSYLFHLFLGLFGLNIFCSAMSRWPWQSKHVPFLLAHLGILILLYGSWITDRFGIDGTLQVSEGESTSAVDIDQPMLVMSEQDKVQTLPIQWLPPEVDFKTISLQKEGLPYDLKVDRYISHADPEFSFVPKEGKTASGEIATPAIHIKLVGGAMRIAQDFWLWAGDPSFSGFQAGPAWLEMLPAGGSPSPRSGKGPRLTFSVEKDGIRYRTESSTGEVVQGKLGAKEIAGKTIDPKWRGGVTISLLEWVPDATVNTTYKPSRIQHGPQAPPSAIRIVAGQGGAGSEVWLGIGSRAMLRTGDRQVEIGYFRKRLILPFAVRLERFTVDYYEGSSRPASYSSRVTVLGQGEEVKDRTISMNEPLKYAGITLYQASYEDAQPRPVTSILSVNRDPGRLWKYVGSLLIVFGSILLFAMKYAKNRSGKKAVASQATAGSIVRTTS